MAQGKIIGGGNLMSLYNVTNATTPVIGSLAITFDDTISTTISRAGGIYNVSIEQIRDDSALATFLEVATAGATSANTEEIVFEDGVRITAAAGGTPYLALVACGTVVGGPDAGKKKLFAGLQAVADTSGSFTQTADTYSRTEITMAGVAAAGTITIPSSLLTGFLTTPATLTIPATLKFGKLFYA